jgi:hypothetical protein
MVAEEKRNKKECRKLGGLLGQYKKRAHLDDWASRRT